MRTLLRLTLLPVALLAGCARPESRTYTPGDGGFTVLMPGTPVERTQDSLAGRPMKTVTSKLWGGAYQVAYFDLPVEPEKVQDRLEGLQNGAVLNIGASTVRARAITLAGKYPGRDVLAELPQGGGLIRLRLYLVEGRFYQVTAWGQRALVESPETDRFLDSFTLTR